MPHEGRGIFSCNINCTRTDEDDHLIGNSNQSRIKGLMGADLIEGNRGNDRIYGGDDRANSTKTTATTTWAAAGTATT